MKWTKEKALKEARKYKNKGRWRFSRESPGAYNFLLKNGKAEIINKAIPRKPNRKRKWTVDKALEESKKYKSRSEFAEKSKGAYNLLQTENKLHLLDKFFPSKNSSYTLKHIKICTKNCTSQSDFKKKFGKEYYFLLRENKLYILDSLLPKRKRWVLEECLECAKLCKTRGEFSDRFRGAYNYLQQRNMLSVLNDLFRPYKREKKVTKKYIFENIISRIK